MAKRQSRKVEDETPETDQVPTDTDSPSVEVSGERVPIVEMKAEEIPAAEVQEETGSTADEAKEHEKHDPVRVRVLAEQGLLAGKAVWRGEVHRVVYWQYLQAQGANPDGYELVE